MRMVIDVTDLPDLELLASAAEAVASQRRVAVELASVELTRAKANGEDVRTRALRVVEMLGDAGRLVELTSALRNAVPLAVVLAERTAAAVTVAASSSAAPGVGAGTASAAQASTGAHSPAPLIDVEALRRFTQEHAAPPAARVSTEPDPADPQAAETLANLRRAGEAALGPDAGHAPAAAESSEVPAVGDVGGQASVGVPA
jgi:hypothetical protein